jgi:hypothetical protein
LRLQNTPDRGRLTGEIAGVAVYGAERDQDQPACVAAV